MKKIIYTIMVPLFIMSTSEAACFVSSELDGLGYHETYTRTYSIKSCSKGYRKLKRLMKDEARTHCRNSEGSPRIDPLKCKHFYKENCTKTRRPGHSTTVTVRGRLTADCR